MSQAKVDRYKEEKANRKAIMKKEKIASFFRKTILGLVCIACVGYVAYSAVNSVTSSEETEYTQINVTDLTDYLSGLEQ